MICKVTLKGADDTETVYSEGDIEFTPNGFDLSYFISNDRCVLSARGATVTQSRRGEVNTDITFAKGKSTICMLLSGELTGSIPVETTDLDIIKGSKGVQVKIDYFLGGAKIKLRLTALTD